MTISRIFPVETAPFPGARSFAHHLGINSLVARDDLAADTALVAKLKVGKEPLEDVGRGGHDVGRAWDVEQVQVYFLSI